MNTYGGCKRQPILKPKIYLKIWKEGGDVKVYRTQKTRRFYAITKADNFQNSVIKARLRVWYGRAITSNGKKEDVVNEGDYTSLQYMIPAFQAFMEPALLSETAQWIRES